MNLTPQQLLAIMPHCPTPKVFAPALVEAMIDGGIITPLVAAAFLAEIAFESDQCRQLTEDTNGLYLEGRRDLGNTQVGDGPKYKGRGCIQITGRDEYTRCGQALGVDLVNQPELAAVPPACFQTAVWYWASKGLSLPAALRNFDRCTKLINGECTDGAPSYQSIRRKYYATALRVMGA